MSQITNASFVFYEILQDHRNTHTGEKPYKCKYCDYRAGNASNWRRHLQSHRYIPELGIEPKTTSTSSTHKSPTSKSPNSTKSKSPKST